jgi:hypothetical protein
MHGYGLLITSLVIGVAGSVIVNDLTGTHLKGWKWWIYDIPAFVSGVLLGLFLARH